jgi:hypothetical protein
MKTGLKRDPIDKFYTQSFVVQICYKLIKKYLKIKKSDLVIEPSAGNGSWIPVIKKLSNNYMLFDIKPEHEEIAKQDFLKIRNIQDFYLIGNPPFGRKSSTAIKFIKHGASMQAKAIAFILPNSFKKASFQKAFPLNYHLKIQKDIPENAFIFDDKPYDVKSVFQIWEKRNYNRKQVKKLLPSNLYEFTNKENCDISIRRVGFGVGKVKQCSKEDNTNTNWFIKLHKNVDLNVLNQIKFNKTQNTGALSISKQDIIRKYNKLIDI